MVVAKDSRTAPQGCLGRHLVAEFLGCNVSRLERVSLLKKQAAEACRLAGATVLSVHGHKFSPQGATAVVILAEYLSIHTWPEYGYAAVDVYTCGARLRPEKAVEHLARCLEARGSAVLALSRGRFTGNGNGEVQFLPEILTCSGSPRIKKNGHDSPQGNAAADDSYGPTESAFPAWECSQDGDVAPPPRQPGVASLRTTSSVIR